MTLIALGVAFPVQAADVNVSAAASLKEALTEIAAGFEKESSDKLIFNFGASNLLARQIEEGAPADIFFSADEAKMDELAKKALIVTGTRKSLLSNLLAVVVPADSTLVIRTARDLAGAEVKHVALGDPRAVPAGVYARQYLEKIGIWTAVEPKIVPTENVRAVLAAVESGNVDAGIVYRSDTRISKKVKVSFIVPAGDGPPISYPASLLKEAKQPVAARKFLEYLTSAAATQLFEKYGFVVLK